MCDIVDIVISFFGLKPKIIKSRRVYIALPCNIVLLTKLNQKLIVPIIGTIMILYYVAI